MYGPLHLILAAVLAAAAAAGARAASRTAYDQRIRLLAVSGWVLAALEVCKQLYLFNVINGGVYDWWFFPFQLCSVPMYLCILLPFTRGRVRDAFLLFMAGCTFVGACATFIFPEDILRADMLLTFHGFIWHGILLFISLVIMMSGMAKMTRANFAGFILLMTVMSIIAVMINAAVEPVMQASYAAGLLPHSYSAMFYLNPYHISPQPVVGPVQRVIGIPAGLVLYVLSIIAASGVIDLAATKISAK